MQADLTEYTIFDEQDPVICYNISPAVSEARRHNLMLGVDLSFNCFPGTADDDESWNSDSAMAMNGESTQREGEKRQLQVLKMSVGLEIERLHLMSPMKFRLLKCYCVHQTLQGM